MRIVTRRLDRGEVDYELVYLGASLTSLSLAAVWFALGLPWPNCVFHDITGLPCLTCGMTRCGIQFFHGHFLMALKWNPLVFTALCVVIAFDVYVLAMLVTRAPRLRIHLSTQREKTFLRASVVSALALNWMYLLLHWRNF